MCLICRFQQELRDLFKYEPNTSVVLNWLKYFQDDSNSNQVNIMDTLQELKEGFFVKCN